MTTTDEQKAAEQKAAEDKAAAEAAAKAAEKAVKKAAETPKRYAAFDASHGRYVGGVRDTKAEAEKIAKGIRDAGHKAEVREV